MTHSFSTSFTRTHAREIASLVAADLRLMHRYYARPSLAAIDRYETEFVELLVAGYLYQVEYGFKKNGDWVTAVRYTVRPGSGEPERAGGVDATADVSGASFYSYLKYSSAFQSLSPGEREKFEKSLPVQRSPDTEPGSGFGYWLSDRTYGAGGVSAARESFKRAA